MIISMNNEYATLNWDTGKKKMQTKNVSIKNAIKTNTFKTF